MADEPKDRGDDAPELTQNPEGEFRQKPESGAPDFRRNVSGQEAADAGRRATDDEPVTRREVIHESAYQDDSADAGQRAAEAEEAKKRE